MWYNQTILRHTKGDGLIEFQSDDPKTHRSNRQTQSGNAASKARNAALYQQGAGFLSHTDSLLKQMADEQAARYGKK